MALDRLFSSPLERLTDQVLQPVQDWLTLHPFWNWLLIHPVWLLGVVVLVLFLFAGLMGAIARLTEAIWLALLQAPIRLAQLLFIGVAKLLQLPFTAKPKVSPASQPNSQERLTAILNRLENLRQEQDELLQEVRSILGETNSNL